MALPANWVGGHRVPALPEGQREESVRSAREHLEAVGVRGGAERAPGRRRDLDRLGAPPRGKGRGLGPSSTREEGHFPRPWPFPHPAGPRA